MGPCGFAQNFGNHLRWLAANNLLTAAQLSALRPSLVVRAWPAFRSSLLLACGLFLAAFYAAWLAARRDRATRRAPRSGVAAPRAAAMVSFLLS